MARRDDRLTRLAEVGAALRDAALARLRAAAAECRRVQAEIDALEAEALRFESEEDFAIRAISGEARARWHRERRKTLNAALARARAEEAARLHEAARAFGRDDALRRLGERTDRKGPGAG